MFDNRKVLPNT